MNHLARAASGQLDDLLALEDGLTPWEVEFVERLANERKALRADDAGLGQDAADEAWYEQLTRSVVDKLQEVYDERC
jgi:hypothetical protein